MRNYGYWAHCLYEAGQVQQAKTTCSKALDSMPPSEQDMSVFHAKVYDLWGSILLDEGGCDPARSVELHENALCAIERACGSTSARIVKLLCHLARAQAFSGAFEDAISDVERALQVCSTSGNSYDLHYAQLTMAEVVFSRGQANQWVAKAEQLSASQQTSSLM